MSSDINSPDTLERLIPNLAGRYAIERELGRGGMATVFLAKDLKHDREVAIKVLHPDLAATIGSERFEREIHLAAKLQHPHILGLYDSGNADGLFFYVMPFVRGESLRDRLEREGQLSVDDALQITLEVADALGYAHEQGIVHRDIKPENILLSNGHALVADFGIARAATEVGTKKLTNTGMALGTPVYMSPEQASGEAVGPTADIYSLGCVLYEMLAGDPPFTGKNSMAIMARHAMDTVPSVRIVRPAIPEEVEEAIYAAMEKIVADRPKSAAEFAAILGMPLGATSTRRVTARYTAQRRVITPPPGELAPKRWWNAPWVPVVGAAVVIGVSVAAWRIAGVSHAGPGVPVADSLARRVAVLYFRDDSKDGALRAVADGLTEGLIRALGDVQTLNVVSRNGVTRFRGTAVPEDSVARTLRVGTLITGSVEPEGSDRVKVTTKLLDRNGADLGERSSFVISRDSLLGAGDRVSQEVARSLRQAIGSEVRLRESQAGTKSLAAWSLLNQGEKLRKDAQAAVAAADTARAIALFAQADTSLQQAESRDPRWIDPVALRGEATLQRGRLEADKAARDRWYQAATAHAQRALALDPTSARALALRGTIAHTRWRLDLSPDPVARKALLESAEQDLLSAVQKDGTLASAYATLTALYYDKKDVPTSYRNAREAYLADAYLSNAAYILGRLFWGAHDTEAFADATKWCAEGQRRFPGDYFFTQCQLFLMITPDAQRNIPVAWRLAAAVDSLAPRNNRAFQSHVSRMIVGGVIGLAGKAATGPARTALLDSARHVLVQSRADPSDDPQQELPGYEAIMRAQMGDYDEAISLLKRYVAVNPDHSFQVGGNVHWWWRALKDQAGFTALMTRQR